MSNSDEDHLQQTSMESTKKLIKNNNDGAPIREPKGQVDGIPDDLFKPFYCGCGPVHPRWLQVFAKKKFMTFLLCSFVCLHSSVVSGFTSVVISTIERRYKFSSTAAGFIFVSYDLTVAIGIVLSGYFASTLHKPRVLGMNCILLAVACLIFASPQVLLESYSAAISDSLSNEYCLESANMTVLQDCSSGNSIAYAIFVLSTVLLAVPATFLYTIGVTYIDEIVFPRFVSLHFGIIYVFLIIGPAIGYGIGSVCLSIYVDPWESTTLTESDPAWVGAWWIPFIFIAILFTLLSVPFLMFPKWLSDSHLVREERRKEMAIKSSLPYDVSSKPSKLAALKRLPTSVKKMIMNPSLMCAAFGLASSYIFYQGFIAFGAKYVENQFYLTPSSAGLTVGAIGVIGALIGILSGSFLVYCLKATGKRNMFIIFVISVAILPVTLGFLLHCPSTSLAGVTIPYRNGSQSGIDSSPCAINCNCTSNVFEPVCGSDGVTYFSPCRAGCSQRMEENGYSYENCSCITGSHFTSSNGAAVEGNCETTCIQIVPTVLVLLYLLTAILATIIPYQHFVVRVVSDEDRSLALGFQSTLWRIFGAVPAPLVFGAVLDSACNIWQEECGRRGNCWLYDNARLSYYVVAIALPCQLVATILYLFAWLTFPKKGLEDPKEESLEPLNGPLH